MFSRVHTPLVSGNRIVGGRKSYVTNRAPLAASAPRLGAILRGNIRRCSYLKIHGWHEGIEYRCRIGTDVSPRLFPRGESKRRRSVGGVPRYSKAKRFSRHSKRALRAYIWRVGGPQIAPDFQQRLTLDIGTRKVVARNAREVRLGRRLYVAWVAEAVHPLCLLASLSHPLTPYILLLLFLHLVLLLLVLPRFWLSRQYNSKMVAGLRVPLSFLSPVSARPPGYYCTPGATPWTLR